MHQMIETAPWRPPAVADPGSTLIATSRPEPGVLGPSHLPDAAFAPSLARILESFGFRFEAQRGSHEKLRRIGPNGRRETLHISRGTRS